MGKVLITGCTGFIGSHLVEKLIKEGYYIVAIDNLSRGKIENLNSVINDITFIHGDITNFDLIKDSVRKVDAVYHLAALSRVIPSIQSPKLCFKSNVTGTEIIARLCAKYKKKLIFSSSREVYGDAEYIPVDEKHPLNPKNPYGASKVAGEKIIEAYSKCYGLDHVILRLGNVYGERDFERVIPLYIDKCLKGDDLIVYGGNQVLDFVFISDVIDALLKAVDISNDNDKFNVGSGVGVRIIELAKHIKGLINTNSQILIKKSRKGEVEEFIADISKIKKSLGWRPAIKLEDGLNDTIKRIINKKMDTEPARVKTENAR
jgi:UDP-glucose 4-epimerase